MKFLYLLSLIIFSESFCCEVNLPSKILLIGNELGSIKNVTQNCDANVEAQLSKIILSSNGMINPNILKEELEAVTQTQNIYFASNNTRIIKINDLIAEKFNLPPGWFFNNITETFGNNIVYLGDGDQIDFNCSSCEALGNKRLSLNITNPLNQAKNIWLKADLMANTKALVTMKALGPHDIKLNDSISETNYKTANPSDLFVDVDSLKFYKLNKPIAQGSPLKHSDLTALKLTSPGKTVKAILSNGRITLSQQVVALKAGHFGESIQLKNPNTKKVFNGKVVDFNKVEVEL